MLLLGSVLAFIDTAKKRKNLQLHFILMLGCRLLPRTIRTYNLINTSWDVLNNIHIPVISNNNNGTIEYPTVSNFLINPLLLINN